MSVVSIQKFLQGRYDEAVKRFKRNHRPELGPDDPAFAEHVAELGRLDRLGLDRPLPVTYAVAAFDEPPANRLQDLARGIYYTKPRRFHFLLPFLGRVSPARPGKIAAGWLKPNDKAP